MAWLIFSTRLLFGSADDREHNSIPAAMPLQNAWSSRQDKRDDLRHDPRLVVRGALGRVHAFRRYTGNSSGQTCPARFVANVTASSTGASSGNWLTANAVRVWAPSCGPRTAIRHSEAPSSIQGCDVNLGAEAT